MPIAMTYSPIDQFGPHSCEPSEPAWLTSLRSVSADAFNAIGVPSAKHEEWRYTNLAPIREHSFQPGSSEIAPAALQETLARTLNVRTATRLIFINGRFAPDASTMAQETGVEISTLTRMLRSDPGALESELGAIRDVDNDAFAALNTALFINGPVIRIRQGAQTTTPIHIVHITANSSIDNPVASHPRALIVVEPDASATIIEESLSNGAAAVFTNAMTEIHVGARARCILVSVSRDNDASWRVSNLRVQQDDDSDFAAHSLLLGCALTRNNVSPVLAGERCHSVLNGVYLPRNTQHMDNHMRVVHAAPSCQSRQFYTGVMQDQSRGVFTGRIIVEQGAQKTDAIQSNRNLLLSPDARANTKPQLEIYADDVRCTHGATIGQLDEDAVFYLQARGVAEPQAKALLLHAFVQESLNRIEDDNLRDLLTPLIAQRLPGASEPGPAS